MNSNIKADIDNTVPKFSLTQVKLEIMEIWRGAEEGSELYKQCEALTKLVQEKEQELDSIRGIINSLVQKL